MLSTQSPNPLDQADLTRLRLLRCGGLLLAAFAATVFSGWLLGFYPYATTGAYMKPAGALAWLLIGLAQAGRGGVALLAMPWLPRLAGAYAVFSALATLVLGPGVWLSGPLTAVMLLCAGLAVALPQRPRGWQPAEWLAAALFPMAASVLLAHLFGVPASSRVFGLSGTSCPTAFACLLAATLQLLAAPNGLLMTLWHQPGSAGLLMRRLLPALLLALPVLGWLRLLGEHLDWYENHEGLVYMVTMAMSAVAVAVVYSARHVDSLDRELRDQASLLDSVVEGTADSVFVKDCAGRYLMVNRVALGIIGQTREDVLNRTDTELMTAADAEALRAADLRVMESGESLVLEESLSLPEGGRFFRSTKSPLRSPEGEIIGVIGLAHEITEEKRHRAALEHQSTHDALTGLANRSLVRDRMRQALVSAERHGVVAALVVLDLDAFKRINEELSYEAGDQLLREVSTRIGQCLRYNDTLARVYGDEFIILLTEVDGKEYVEDVVRRILLAISVPWSWQDGEMAANAGHPAAGEDTEVVLGASAGISLYPEDARSTEEMEKHAEMAMHRAKTQGKNRYEFYQAPLAQDSVRRLDREHALRQALEQGQLVLHCQPKIELASGQICGAEALIRWQHPTRGLLAPNHFLPLAEENGLIVPITEWVVSEACATVKRWQAAGLECGPVALNLSGQQLQDTALADRLARIIDESGIATAAIELEVTETSVLRDHEETARILHRFHDMGLKLALDDFGTGYSSLSFLRKFPISCLKIDRSFVRDIHTDPNDAAIARAVIAMAHALKIHVVAEGVETAAQLRYLHSHQCDQMQGYLFSKAVSVSEFESMVAGHARLDLEAYGLST